MRGFFGAQGNYYEADDPLNPTDLEVVLRPSEAYILGPNGKLKSRTAIRNKVSGESKRK